MTPDDFRYIADSACADEPDVRDALRKAAAEIARLQQERDAANGASTMWRDWLAKEKVARQAAEARVSQLEAEKAER